MARVKRGVTAHAKHKKVLKAAKGFYGGESCNRANAFQSSPRQRSHSDIAADVSQHPRRGVHQRRVTLAGIAHVLWADHAEHLSDTATGISNGLPDLNIS